MFQIFAVERSACSPLLSIDGQTCRLVGPVSDTCEFAYLTLPCLGIDGCYSISVKRNSGQHGQVGFGLNEVLSRSTTGPWKSTVSQSLNGLASRSSSLGITASATGMGREIGDDTLTLMYNPSLGTLHGAYNLEPAILLRKEIPIGVNAPLQPFIGSGTVGTSITVVNNPR